MIDLVVRGGVVVDGTGRPGRRADVGVHRGRIVAVGTVEDPARRMIDAGGLTVTPGLVDPHTHYDAQVLWDPALSPSALHGITSTVSGNCGFSTAPLTDESRDYVMQVLSRVEDIPLASLRCGGDWSWRSTEEFFARVEGNLGMNQGFFTGHATIRSAVMGRDATERPATDPELQRMCELLRASLRAGALGFSTSRTETHKDPYGKQVASFAADARELVALAEVCSAFPGTVVEFSGPLGPTDDEMTDLVARVAAAAAPQSVIYAAVIATEAQRGRIDSVLAASERAAHLGGNLLVLTIPYQPSFTLSFHSGAIFDSLPGWGETMHLPVPERLTVFRDPARREELRVLAAESDLAKVKTFFTWGTKQILGSDNPEVAGYEGRMVADIAAEQGKSDFDALMDIVCADGLRTSFYDVIDRRPADWAYARDLIRDHNVLVGGSDAGAHLDMIDSYNLTSNFLAAVRERGLVDSFERAIHLLTDVPARLFGLSERGRVENGWYADLVLMDPETVGPELSRPRDDMPAGATRLYGGATGIHRVMVNGVDTVVDGELTGATPGQLLRSC